MAPLPSTNLIGSFNASVNSDQKSKLKDFTRISLALSLPASEQDVKINNYLLQKSITYDQVREHFFSTPEDFTKAIIQGDFDYLFYYLQKLNIPLSRLDYAPQLLNSAVAEKSYECIDFFLRHPAHSGTATHILLEDTHFFSSLAKTDVSVEKFNQYVCDVSGDLLFANAERNRMFDTLVRYEDWNKIKCLLRHDSAYQKLMIERSQMGFYSEDNPCIELIKNYTPPSLTNNQTFSHQLNEKYARLQKKKLKLIGPQIMRAIEKNDLKSFKRFIQSVDFYAPQITQIYPSIVTSLTQHLHFPMIEAMAQKNAQIYTDLLASLDFMRHCAAQNCFDQALRYLRNTRTSIKDFDYCETLLSELCQNPEFRPLYFELTSDFNVFEQADFFLRHSSQNIHYLLENTHFYSNLCRPDVSQDQFEAHMTPQAAAELFYEKSEKYQALTHLIEGNATEKIGHLGRLDAKWLHLCQLRIDMGFFPPNSPGQTSIEKITLDLEFQQVKQSQRSSHKI